MRIKPTSEAVVAAAFLAAVGLFHVVSSSVFETIGMAVVCAVVLVIAGRVLEKCFGVVQYVAKNHVVDTGESDV